MRTIAFFPLALCLLLSATDSENTARATGQQPLPTVESHHHHHYRMPNSYSALHYWFPRVYVFRAYGHPVQYRQYLWPQSGIMQYSPTEPPIMHAPELQQDSPSLYQRYGK